VLLRDAIERQGVRRVDVNEQNHQAFGFYQRFGFAVTGRSDTDGQGKPYPLLHLGLSQDKFAN
jgi:putative acetyltransferase